MSSSQTEPHPLRNVCAYLSLPRKAVLSVSLVASLMIPASLLARETVPTDIRPLAELALHQPAGAPAAGEIRMKLYGLEDLRATEAAPAETAESSDAEEIKKQAQTRYLASKLKKREAALRKYVDLAWAEAAKRQLLDPELLIAIIHKESEFRPKVQSRYGAQGLMQVVPRWHREKLRPSESLFDPEVNIRVGADVLEEYLAQAGGNMENALRKYSGNARNYASHIRKESRNLARIAEQAAG